MSRSRLVDQGFFALWFLVAALLGRQAVLEDGGIALVWPAAGVAVAWCAVTGWRGWLLVDLGLVFACAWAVNDLTGADTPLAMGLALGTVVQVLAFGLLINRWRPGLWGFGDDPPPGLQRASDLGYVLAASFASAVVASFVGPAALLGIADGTWISLVTWVLRNAVAVLAIFPLSLLIRNAARGRERGVVVGRGTVFEATLLAVATAVATWLVFVVNDDLPVPFLLLGTCVWAGLRFSSWVADIHAIALSAGVVVATVLGTGPFVSIEDLDARQLVFQGYVVLVVAINLALSVARREGLSLNQRLAASEAESRSQARMLRTILDTMADGVSVLDTQGRIVLRNPAATQLLGDPRIDEQGRVDAGAYGLFYADGTPMASDGGPAGRAMAGEEVEGIDIVVHQPSAEGRTLQVTARPVPDSDPPLAVTVFHDVTAARRERDELASFAGVVAHDLLNPLTVVEGWSETLLEAARAGVVVPPERQAEQLERIQRAAQRMHHLISDLLAFTTARDLRINPVRVDLGAVAGDVARARVEAARVRGEAAPQIVVAPDLPAVLAEPVLLRQVVDNLVGNAVKYVAPGVVPDVRLTARALEPADDAPMVVIEVSDNGIGIPEDQQSRVFDSFHRAHAGESYRGTGLGLSIVKRVAERHGGTAWAAANPVTGGTTMSVTFPAASLSDGPSPTPQEQ